MAVVAQQLDKLRALVSEVPALKKLGMMFEDATSVNFEYAAAGILAVALIMLFTGIGDEFIVHLCAFVYPFVQTIKVIEAGDKSAYTDWLIYWVIYGFVSVLDTFSDWLLYWIPFFAPLKLAFLVWCWLPSYRGSSTIYYSVIQPLWKQHESTIDSALKNVLDPKVILKNAVKAASAAAGKDE